LGKLLSLELAVLAKRLHRQKPKCERLSLRAISAELAAQDFLNENGRPFAAPSIKNWSPTTNRDLRAPGHRAKMLSKVRDITQAHGVSGLRQSIPTLTEPKGDLQG
jgi:hypothetical protein